MDILQTLASGSLSVTAMLDFPGEANTSDKSNHGLGEDDVKATSLRADPWVYRSQTQGQYSRVGLTVAGHFVPCPLRNLPLRTTKNNRPTSSYHLYLPVRNTSTYHFVPTTSYLPLRTTFFLMFYVGRWSLLEIF